MANTIQLKPRLTEGFDFALTVKNLHHFSPHDERARRYPFLVAIDLTVHFALSLSAIILSVIAIAMGIDAVLPGVVRIPPFWMYL